MRPSRVVVVALAFALAGCSTVHGDIGQACVLGLVALESKVLDTEIDACVSHDEAILGGMAEVDRAQAEECLACVARKDLQEAVCFVACKDGACAPVGLGACESACGNHSMEDFCARGGEPAQRADLR